jgi:CHAT domain-containing protein/tetratricopeptide (TPR) repeat protein
VVVRATRAVEGDSAHPVVAAWSAAVRADSADWGARLGLATLARLSYGYVRADSIYQHLMAVTAPAAGRFVALARLGYGNGLQTRGLNAAADSAYARAAADAASRGDRGVEASALVALAALRARTVGPNAADSLLRLVPPLIARGDPLIQSEYYCARAALLQMTGRPGVDSMASLGSRLAAEAGAPRQRAYCRRILGISVMDRNEDLGFGILDEVVRELSAARDRAALASVLQWWGYRHVNQFNYGSARADLLRAVEEGRAAGAPSPVAWAYLNLAQLSSFTGDFTAGRRYADSAQVLFQAQGDRWGLGTLPSIQAGIAHAAGDVATARERYREALPIAQAFGGAGSTVLIESGLASVEMDAGNLDEADRLLRMARATARRNNLRGYESGLTYPTARLAMLRGRPDLAARVLRPEVHDAIQRGTQPGVAYQWGARLADALARQGRVADAERELGLASDALDSARNKMSDRVLRTVVLSGLRDMQGGDFGIASVLAALVAAGRAEAAFEFAERRRASELLGRMVLRQAVGRSGKQGSDSLRFASSRRLLAAGGIEALQSAVPDDGTALVEYVTGSEGAPTTVFVLTRTRFAAFRLSPLDSLAGDLRRFMTLVESGENPGELGRKLGTALLGPVVEALPAGVTRLLVVPDAGLHRVAFDAFALPDGRLVASRFAVSFSPSATVAAQLWRLEPQDGPPTLLAFGDPQFAREVPAGTEAEVYRDAFNAGGGLTRLAASAGEARAVAAYAPNAQVRLRSRASEAYLKRESLRGFRILHFAAHAVVDEQSPARTALALAPGEGEDGFVTATDLASLDLDADLVVLSACRTAGGVFIRGEGIEGLTAPLLEAGARSVVATLWRVGDRTAAAFVERFYTAMARGLSSGDALAAAKRDEIARGTPPSVWAAFTLVGNPAAQIPLREPRVSVLLVIGGGAVALLVLRYGWTTLRRRTAERS